MFLELVMRNNDWHSLEHLALMDFARLSSTDHQSHLELRIFDIDNCGSLLRLATSTAASAHRLAAVGAAHEECHDDEEPRAHVQEFDKRRWCLSLNNADHLSTCLGQTLFRKAIAVGHETVEQFAGAHTVSEGEAANVLFELGRAALPELGNHGMHVLIMSMMFRMHHSMVLGLGLG